AMESVTKERSESAPIRRVVQKITTWTTGWTSDRTERSVVAGQVGIGKNGFLLCLIESIARIEEGEARLNGLVEYIWLSKPEGDVIHQGANLRAQTEGLAEPEKIVCRIREADEASGYRGNAAVQLNRVLAALLDFKQQVDGVGFGVARNL